MDLAEPAATVVVAARAVPGGSGGSGGGGAGGTIELVGSVVNTAGDVVNTAGGQGGVPGLNDGSSGRLVFGSNLTLAAFSGTNIGAQTQTYSGSTDANPFLGGTTSPTIPGLVGGAEAYGLTGLTATNALLPSVTSAAPANAQAVLIRRILGPQNFDYDFAGYDMLLYVNLTGQAIGAPKLSVGSVALQQLLQGGYLTNPQFTPGATGPQLLSQLSGYQVYATLIPTGTTTINVGGSVAGVSIGAQGVALQDGQYTYLTNNGLTNQTVTAAAYNTGGSQTTTAPGTVASFSYSYDVAPIFTQTYGPYGSAGYPATTTITLSATDPDSGDPQIYTASSNNSNVVASVSGSQLTLTPASGFAGTAQITVTVSDGPSGADDWRGRSATQSFNYTVGMALLYGQVTQDLSQNANGPGLTGVTVDFDNSQGQVLYSTTTDANGNYTLSLPKNLTGRLVAQPPAYCNATGETGGGGYSLTTSAGQLTEDNFTEWFVVNPLANQTVNEGQPVTLTADLQSRSGDNLSSSWTVYYGSQPVTLGSGNSFTFTPQHWGTYSVNLQVTDTTGTDVVTGGYLLTSTVVANNVAPTVATSATASPSTVSGTTTALSVLGGDVFDGESNLTYTWATTGTPPAPVTFSANVTNAAKNTTATFTQAGSYAFQVTITNSGGLFTTSTVTVTVNQMLTSVTVSPATVGLGASAAQQFAATAYDQFGTAMATQPTFAWTTTVGSINASGQLTAPAASSTGTVTATAAPVSGTSAVTVTDHAPTVATPAAATPGAVTGTSTALSVLGADVDTGESSLTYTWAATTLPGRAAAPMFSANGTNAAKNTTATFSQAGNYVFTVTIRDPGGLTTSSNVGVTVSQTLTSIAVSPATVTLNENQAQQFSATALDQFGNALASQPSFSWAMPVGTGSISASGLYTSPGSPGTATVTATSGSITGSAAVTTINASPTVATAAAASPSIVTATTTALSVLGADDGGEANLTYTWATAGAAPAAVTFSANGTHAASNTTATFAAAGSYTFQVTITDAGGLFATSYVGVTVNQTFTNVSLSPGTTSLNATAVEQVPATALDQFGNPLASQPAFAWSSTIGTISAGGLFTAPSASATGTVTATSGSVSGVSSLAVTTHAPTVATPAAATPGAVTGTSTALSVLGADVDTGESGLTYTWVATTVPSGAAAPTFSANASNAAKNTTATFSKIGNYVFTVTINGLNGTMATSSVNVSVSQTLTSIASSPASVTLDENQIQQFTASGYDQFGYTLSSQPGFAWAMAGGTGSINSTGLYTAPGRPVRRASRSAAVGSWARPRSTPSTCRPPWQWLPRPRQAPSTARQPHFPCWVHPSAAKRT